MPRTVWRKTGLAGSTSILRRSRLICTSTVRSLAAAAARELLARHVAAGLRPRMVEDLALALGDADDLVLAPQLAAVEAERRRGRSGCRRGVAGVGARRGRRRASGCCRAAGSARAARRAWQVVVGADLEPVHPVGRLGAGGQHQDRHLRARPGCGGRSRSRSRPASSRRGRGRRTRGFRASPAPRRRSPPWSRDSRAADRKRARSSRRRRSSSTTSTCGAWSGMLDAGAAPSSSAPPDGRRTRGARPGRGRPGRSCASRKRLVVSPRAVRLVRRARARSAGSAALASSSASSWPCGGGVEQPLAPVGRAGPALDEALVDQFLEHPVEALLGDPQDVQEFGDRQARLAVDEMQHPVMGAPETEVGQDAVGIADEVAIGEEEQLDQVVGRPLAGMVLGRRAGAWRTAAWVTIARPCDRLCQPC